MTDKKKRRIRKHAAKTGMSYQAARNALYDGDMASVRSSTLNEAERCPECDGSVRIEQLLQTFQHGLVPDVVTLHVTVPVRLCTKCGFQYTNAEANDLRAEAVHRARFAP
ncbi:MAG: hypothetical protein JWN48_2652 [Myxococcaceae bacterium]|nr:hypothetical protein [Myxococcaceae bacterium]